MRGKRRQKGRREVRREVNPQNPALTPCSESWPLLSSRLAMATMADAPRPAILFADSFFHDRLCQHVDEVRFTEPVVITGCEVVGLHQSSLCPTLSLKGVTSPDSCAVEFFVRSGGESRFQPLGPSFIHSLAATSLLDVQAAVTEHLVLRGNYKSLTLVIYGNLAKELCLDRNRAAFVSSSKSTFNVDMLQEVLDTQLTAGLALSSLQLISPPTAEQGQLLHRFLKCLGGADPDRNLVSVLLMAAAALHVPLQISVNGAHWIAAKKLDPLDSPVDPVVDDINVEVQELHDWVQQREEEGKQRSTEEGAVQSLLSISQTWLQAGLDSSCGLNTPLSAVESLVGGLAAVQLLCNKDPGDVQPFLAAGGMKLLLQVVEEVSETTGLLLFALTSVECACRHGCGCEALLSEGKEPLLALRHKMQRPPITRLLQRVVHRLQCYELARSFELLVDQLTKLSASEDVVVIETATKLLNELLESITASCVVDKDSAKADLVFTGLELLTPTALGDMRFTNTLSDIDPALLSLLQEKCFMRTLAIFSSTPDIWTATGGSPNVYIEFAAVTQRLLLVLFSCRSGLLFLNGDLEAASTIITSLMSSSGQETQEAEVSPIRHATVLTSLGFLRTPRDLAGMLQSRIAVMNAADRLVGADKGSEAAFWALWNLSTIARSEAGRQALLAVIWFPEVLTSLMVVLHPSPEFMPAMGEAAGHFAAEVLEKVFCDAALTNQTALTRHASALQMALQSACNIGMTSCSRILEWVEAAVVYEKKGAVGLLKHAAALIGPQNTSAIVHVDGSMDDDANNRGPGAELPNSHSKGMMNALIQDSAVHALTISLKLLAPSAQNMGIAASLYGEGAMGVVTAILEHCLAALQASSIDDDDEDAEEEEEGRGQEQDKERVLLALLLPTLVLLLSLLKRLQAVVQQYCSTRVLDLLLRIHHVVSAKEGAYGMVPPYSWSGGVLEVGAVQHVLASLLAFWPIFGWGPALLPRLLGPNSTSLPVEPGEACSVICLLEECLPPECPRLLLNRAAVADLYRSVAAGSIYGEDVLSAIQWHTSPVNMEKILHALYPHLEQLGQLLLRLAPSSCDVVQERLTSLVTRLGCQSAEHAAILVRPVLSLLQEQTSSASRSALTEIDILQVERMLRWVASLALHPSSKAVLLQEDAVQVLVQALSSVSAPTLQPTVSRMGWLFWSCKAVAPLCDTSISFLPATSMDRHLVEDCPEYDDCCAIAFSLFPFFQTMPMEKHMEILALALDKLGSHDLGRAALATVAMSQPGITPSVTNEDLLESESSLVADRDSLPWIKLWQNLAASLDSNEILNPVHVGLIRRFALAATVLSDSGQSAYGVVALKAMFGLIPVAERQGNKTSGEILQSLDQIMDILGQHIIELETSEPLSPVSISSLQEAHSAVSKILEVLKEPAKEFNLSEEVDSLLGRLPAPRPVAERRAEALKSTSRWKIFSSEIPAEEIESLDAEIGDTASDVRGTIPWDCPRSLQETPGMTMSMSKRRIISTIEVPGKRQRGEGGASALVSRTTAVITSNRRDTFRQRKPNTSRPPSMHVDDYVAREKSSDAIPGTTSVTTTLQRSNSSMGRPPSIHVDEFLARQKDRQQPPAPTVAQPSVANSGSRLVQDFPEPGEERHTLGLMASSNINQGMTEYSSMGVAAPGVPSTSASIPSPHNFSSADSVMPTGLSSGPGPQVQPINRPEHLQRSASSLTTALSSEVTSFTSHRTDGVKKERSSGGVSSRVEIHTRSQSTSAVKVKLERAPSAKNTSVGPPPPPPPPHPQLPPNAAGTSSVKKESRQQFERSNSGRPSPSGVPGGPSSSTASEQPPLSGMTGHPVPPPPPPPPPSSHSWLDTPRRLEPPLLQPAMPMMMPHMNVGPFNLGSAPRPPADLQVGGALLQSPGGMWHEPPSPFTSLPPPVLQAPGLMQQGPAYLHQPYVASRPVDMMHGYPVNHAGGASSSDRRFGSFSPLPGQGLPLPPPPPPPPPPPFQPPVPAGLPLVQNILDAQQSAHHPPPLHLQEAEISAQQEPGAVLQQILASPDTIQELLKDPKKLQQLLEQHPKLITLLQEKMSSGML